MFRLCWLCTFAIPEEEKGFNRPSTFKVASNIVVRYTFSLVVPMFAGIYYGLNDISSVSKPANSMSFFPTYYLYGWLASYFNTSFVLEPFLVGP